MATFSGFTLFNSAIRFLNSDKAQELLADLESQSFEFPHASEAVFTKVTVFGRPSAKAFVYLPGFRADDRAAASLALELDSRGVQGFHFLCYIGCLLYTSDAADE